MNIQEPNNKTKCSIGKALKAGKTLGSLTKKAQNKKLQIKNAKRCRKTFENVEITYK